MIYNLYIFNRDNICLYYVEWARERKAKSRDDEFKLMAGFLYSMKQFANKLAPTMHVDGSDGGIYSDGF